jgi:hypothetical protein
VHDERRHPDLAEAFAPAVAAVEMGEHRAHEVGPQPRRQVDALRRGGARSVADLAEFRPDGRLVERAACALQRFPGVGRELPPRTFDELIPMLLAHTR